MLGLLFVKPVFAGEPPTQMGPENGSTVSSSSLNWQAPSYSLYSSNPYRVQIHIDPSFSPVSSIYRDSYKTATTYTPALYPGTWYWRIEARDSTGTWSSWSNTWSFNLIEANPTPAPTSSPTPTATSTPLPTNSSTSSFLISNIPSQINSGQQFSVLINLSLPNNPNNTFYLKGAFKKADSTNYFGQTKVSGNWVKNGGNYSSQYSINTDSSGNWSGNLEIQPDSEDSGFTGTGDYIFKVARYTSAGSGPTWSNESGIKITAVENTNQGGISPDNSSSTTTPLSSPQLEQSAKSKTAANKSKSYDTLVYHSATVAAATTSTTPSSTPEKLVKSPQQINFLSIIGSILVIIGIIPITYAIYNKFGKRNKESS
ncbi:hypothetical protein HYZ05_03290 [Candidatus Daviesbacteria bacterium]|nr:hypothetical protein [Candidatus Daviesbacteria bacterium]